MLYANGIMDTLCTYNHSMTDEKVREFIIIRYCLQYYENNYIGNET